MDIKRRVKAFTSLGEILLNAEAEKEITIAIEKSLSQNPWFTKKDILYALSAIGNSLEENNIKKWISQYKNEDIETQEPKTIAVIMAGNIPLVGFHDLLCVLISGNFLLAKLSSNDQYLLPAIAKLLSKIEPDFQSRIQFTTEKINTFDAIIATGSDNTARYFEYYFGKYPNIIRKNRNSVAVLNGYEKGEELTSLSDDIFLYFGLGCRNVSKLFVPEVYDFSKLTAAFQKYSFLADFNKYRNNYEYQKTILLMNNIHFTDGTFFLIKNNCALSSPLSTIHVEYYKNIQTVNDILNSNKDQIQCVVSNISEISDKVAIGRSQMPQLWDYADGIDSLLFLSKLS